MFGSVFFFPTQGFQDEMHRGIDLLIAKESMYLRGSVGRLESEVCPVRFRSMIWRPRMWSLGPDLTPYS